eukprot:14714423-Ditylum_brightwellii.AAC.1
MKGMSEVDVMGDKTTKFYVANWTHYPIMKARVANEGEEGHILQEGTNIYQQQIVDNVQDNTFIISNIGSGSGLKYKIFHHFFAVQDPIITPPPKERCPNYKVDSLFTWMGYTWKKMWLLAPD